MQIGIFTWWVSGGFRKAMVLLRKCVFRGTKAGIAHTVVGGVWFIHWRERSAFRGSIVPRSEYNAYICLNRHHAAAGSYTQPVPFIRNLLVRQRWLKSEESCLNKWISSPEMLRTFCLFVRRCQSRNVRVQKHRLNNNTFLCVRRERHLHSHEIISNKHFQIEKKRLTIEICKIRATA